jgi:hypothetical protein
MPAPGASADFWFAGPLDPDLLSVSAWYAQTTPAADYTFDWAQSSVTIVVHSSELSISASCTGGCSIH